MFEDKHHRRPNSLPMHRLVGFALFSTRRQEEITRVAWKGLDQTHSRVFIKDMKHPGDKVGNDVWCDLPPPRHEHRAGDAKEQTTGVPISQRHHQRRIHAGMQSFGN
jgi:hypothetical protein